MGRSNYIILGMGVAACVLLSLMMQHAVKVHTEESRPRVVVELEENFSFSQPAEWSTREVEPGGPVVAELVVYPQLSSSMRRTVRGTAEYVWRNLHGAEGVEFDVLVVEARLSQGSSRRFQVSDPRRLGASMRLLGEGEEPVIARAAPKKVSRPAAPASRPAETASRPTASRPTPAGARPAK